MKFSALILLASLCFVDVVTSTILYSNPNDDAYSLSKRSPAKDKGGKSSRGSGGGGGGGKAPKSKARAKPCASMDPLPAGQFGHLCAGNNRQNTAGFRRPAQAKFDRAAIEAALTEAENGKTFSTATKEYPDTFFNTYSKAVPGQKTRQAGLMFPAAATKDAAGKGKGKGATSTGDDLMEYPIFAPGYEDEGKAGAFRIIYSHNRVNNKCKFVGITEHLNGGQDVVKCNRDLVRRDSLGDKPHKDSPPFQVPPRKTQKGKTSTGGGSQRPALVRSNTI
ncbi:uncharacterized protein H6S33_004903 [Morchella sextelata]|uniref:uncharacterized protein n=1 Tax=Morchella sextelata TaxID=1174677 RepID=UPI001D051DCD|nr:uncharacterized protein H6S33_004903 [Morchella sextelata]KAH0605681.1 hypothetical protein H6S33_004903 [Morchella sextelata]